MEDRILGMIAGLAVGDALGAPLEFMSHQQIEIKHGQVTGMIGGGWLHLRPGGYTDDTSLMLCLLKSILEKKDFERDAVAEKYLEWYKARPISIPNVVRASLSRIEAGTPIDEASRIFHEESTEGSSSNGTVKRCAPLAGLYFNDPEKLMEASLLDARITHWDIKAGSGSAMVNLILSGLLREMNKEDAFSWADETIIENDLGLYNPVPDIAFVAEADLSPTEDVVDTLTCAFWHFIHGTSFEKTLVNVVNMGGDTDTIGAVTGALCGAFWGYSKIPKRWERVLEDRGLVLAQAKRLAKLASERQK